jgi:hypothetical protein
LAEHLLSESWKRSYRYLTAARYYLPPVLRESPESGTVAQFEQFLRHNELGLALDELEGIGETNNADPQFWSEMILAAENMELHDHAARYRGKLK